MESCGLKVLICIVSLNIIGTDSKISAAQREYLRVFKIIPRLYDYLVETLDERPEILENNNARTFKRRTEEETNDFIKNIINLRDDDVETEEDRKAKVTKHLQNYLFVDADDDDDDNTETVTKAYDYKERNINKAPPKENPMEERSMSVYYRKVLKLDSDEIAERALEVQKKLEGFNSRR